MSDVRLYHPGRDRTVSVPAHLWPGRLASKGWQLADDPQAPVTEHDVAQAWNAAAAPAVPSQDEPDAQPDEKAQLQQVLTDRGVTGWDGRTGIKKLRQLVEETE